MSRDLARHNVIGAYRDLERGTDAVEVLRDEGFGDDDLSILGEAPEDVDANVERESHEPLGDDVFEHVVVGGAGGGAVGALLGAGVTAGVAAIPGVGLVVGTGALIGAVSGAFAGSTIGSIVEGEAALRSQSGWRQTFKSMKAALTDGGVVIGVHTDDPTTAERARAVLEATDPIDVRLLNEQGHEILEE